MTNWEVGQDLVYLSDEISERMKDMKESHPKAYWMLDEVRRQIGDYFNRHHCKSHKFGIVSHDEEKNKEGGANES
jgi:hypothetical protein